jgi:hypothetical protein
MADITSITAFLGSIKTATEIAKAIREADVSLEKAEAKMKLADMMAALADARMQAVEVQQVIQEKDQRIAELEKALELKDNLVRSGDAYYEVNESGKPIGAPFCSHCWEAKHKAIHLNLDFPPMTKSCPICKAKYAAQRVHDM